MSDELVTVTQAAAILEVERPTMKWIVESHQLETLTLPGGKKRYLKKSDVLRLKEEGWRKIAERRAK